MIMEFLIKELDKNYDLIDCKVKKDKIILTIQSTLVELECPYCRHKTNRVHSYYTREIQDIPLHDKQTVLIVNGRKMFCQNPECNHTTFSEQHVFAEKNGRKTKRLEDKILITSSELSSVGASKLLRENRITVSKSTICEMLKKMPPIVDKSKITRVCVDDFALKKRYTYGTVMVDWDTHRVIDSIPSRDTKEVCEWLKTYPNIQMISRDGASTYASASRESHPDAIQVTDRFHLIKNLAEIIDRYIKNTFPSRVEIPAEKEITDERKALYNTANRAQRIRYAHQKYKEGYTTQEIAYLLHAGERTISTYLSILEDEIPEDRAIVRERQHQEAVAQKEAEIELAKRLYSEGKTISEIAAETHHTRKTIQNYLDPNYSPINGHYDRKRPGKLTPYEKFVVDMRSKGKTYDEIYQYIKQKGYSGSVAAIRLYMQKERAHKNTVTGTSENTEINDYVYRKSLSQLVYKNLEEVKLITKNQ